MGAILAQAEPKQLSFVFVSRIRLLDVRPCIPHGRMGDCPSGHAAQSPRLPGSRGAGVAYFGSPMHRGRWRPVQQELRRLSVPMASPRLDCGTWEGGPWTGASHGMTLPRLMDGDMRVTSIYPQYLEAILDRDHAVVSRADIFSVWATYLRPSRVWEDPPWAEPRHVRVLDDQQRAAGTLWSWHIQEANGHPLLPACTWCGLPTGNCCDVCDMPVCDECAEEFQICRICETA